MLTLIHENISMIVTENGIPLEYIDAPGKLTALVQHLAALKEIAIDTEFDSFNKQYGIHLQLVQVFDGTTCFLVDAVTINDLQELWPVFENRDICKVIYSGANDVDVLKRSGCNLRNLFDVQVAASLCNRRERSLSALLQNEFDVTINKATQAAGWGNRPLETKQLLYASNDVAYLLQLKELLLKEIAEKKLKVALQEENIKLEAATSRDYFPRLTDKQKRVFSKYSQEKLLQLKVLVDDYAKELNLPPFKVVRDELLEDIIKDTHFFLQDAFSSNRFHRKVIENSEFKKEMLEIAHSIDPGIEWQRQRRR